MNNFIGALSYTYAGAGALTRRGRLGHSRTGYTNNADALALRYIHFLWGASAFPWRRACMPLTTPVLHRYSRSSVVSSSCSSYVPHLLFLSRADGASAGAGDEGADARGDGRGVCDTAGTAVADQERQRRSASVSGSRHTPGARSTMRRTRMWREVLMRFRQRRPRDRGPRALWFLMLSSILTCIISGSLSIHAVLIEIHHSYAVTVATAIYR